MPRECSDLQFYSIYIWTVINSFIGKQYQRRQKTPKETYKIEIEFVLEKTTTTMQARFRCKHASCAFGWGSNHI
jgi:hypothetical protein